MSNDIFLYHINYIYIKYWNNRKQMSGARRPRITNKKGENYAQSTLHRLPSLCNIPICKSYEWKIYETLKTSNTFVRPYSTNTLSSSIQK